MHEEAAGKPLQDITAGPPELGSGFTFMENWAGCPAFTVLELCPGEIETMGWIVIPKLAVLLALLPSPPPETVAPTVAEAGALLATFIVTVTIETPLGVTGVDAMHVRLLTVQFQPPPLRAVAVNPVERLIVNVTVPDEGIFPKLLMNIV